MASSKEMMEVQRDLGRIIEGMDNADERHRDLSQRMDKFSDRFDQQGEKSDEVRSQVNKLDQSIQSLAKVTSGIALEKCGERLDHLEAVCKDIPGLVFWHRFLGTGASAVVKVITIFGGSGALGALVIEWLKAHFH